MIDGGTLVSEAFALVRARLSPKCEGMQFADRMVRANPQATMADWLAAITGEYKAGRLDPDWPFGLLVTQFDNLDPSLRDALFPMLGKKAAYALLRYRDRLPPDKVEVLRHVARKHGGVK